MLLLLLLLLPPCSLLRPLVLFPVTPPHDHFCLLVLPFSRPFANKMSCGASRWVLSRDLKFTLSLQMFEICKSFYFLLSVLAPFFRLKNNLVTSKRFKRHLTLGLYPTIGVSHKAPRLRAAPRTDR